MPAKNISAEIKQYRQSLKDIKEKGQVALGKRLRLFSKALADVEWGVTTADHRQLTISLFPWLISDVLSAPYHRGYAGIVMCVSELSNSVSLAYSTILSLRNVLHSKLPIEIFFLGGDLSEESKKKFESFPNVDFRDLTKLFNETTLHLNKIAKFGLLKPFAILGSTFQDVILIDKNVSPLYAPEAFVHSSVYKKTGTVFWKDRSFCMS
jgi:hypothetical protein